MEEIKKKVNSHRFAKILLVAVLLLLCISALFYFFREPIQTESFYASVKIMNHTGIDINSTVLAFGGVMPGSSNTRKIIFENKYGFVIRADISSNGSISDFLSYQRSWMIEENETKELAFSVGVPEDAIESFHDGYIIIEINKAGLF